VRAESKVGPCESPLKAASLSSYTSTTWVSLFILVNDMVCFLKSQEKKKKEWKGFKKLGTRRVLGKSSNPGSRCWFYRRSYRLSRHPRLQIKI
jgi:hypothetical protein